MGEEIKAEISIGIQGIIVRRFQIDSWWIEIEENGKIKRTAITCVIRRGSRISAVHTVEMAAIREIVY